MLVALLEKRFSKGRCNGFKEQFNTEIISIFIKRITYNIRGSALAIVLSFIIGSDRYNSYTKINLFVSQILGVIVEVIRNLPLR